ncbi:hypothetical protein B0H19DRAFT_1063348 [Mycena capillaripes]|nr:hypothetical protein B0H19DRAFT_1063348 [Mycena capillaripes]
MSIGGDSGGDRGLGKNSWLRTISRIAYYATAGPGWAVGRRARAPNLSSCNESIFGAHLQWTATNNLQVWTQALPQSENMNELLPTALENGVEKSLISNLGNCVGIVMCAEFSDECRMCRSVAFEGASLFFSGGCYMDLQTSGLNDGASYEVTSTYASYPYDIKPTMALVNGLLRAYRASGAWTANATAVTSGGVLSWYTSELFDHDVARIYTAIQHHGTSGLHAHAAYGFDDLWSLCLFDGTLA